MACGDLNCSLAVSPTQKKLQGLSKYLDRGISLYIQIIHKEKYITNHTLH